MTPLQTARTALVPPGRAMELLDSIRDRRTVLRYDTDRAGEVRLERRVLPTLAHFQLESDLVEVASEGEFSEKARRAFDHLLLALAGEPVETALIIGFTVEEGWPGAPASCEGEVSYGFLGGSTGASESSAFIGVAFPGLDAAGRRAAFAYALAPLGLADAVAIADAGGGFRIEARGEARVVTGAAPDGSPAAIRVLVGEGLHATKIRVQTLLAQSAMMPISCRFRSALPLERFEALRERLNAAAEDWRCDVRASLLPRSRPAAIAVLAPAAGELVVPVCSWVDPGTALRAEGDLVLTALGARLDVTGRCASGADLAAAASAAIGVELTPVAIGGDAHA